MSLIRQVRMLAVEGKKNAIRCSLRAKKELGPCAGI